MYPGLRGEGEVVHENGDCALFSLLVVVSRKHTFSGCDNGDENA